MHWAVHFKNRLILEYVLAIEQDLELKDSFGHTALHHAMKSVDKDQKLLFVKTLLTRGANPKTLTSKDETCL